MTLKDTVILAYSGGLDTSVAIPWLAERGYDVVALAADLGANLDLKAIQEKALKVGAVRSYVVDARERFAEEYILPALRANALYEGVYPLSAALSRPLIADLLVAVAHAEQAKFVAHGCTGKGNDQVRFDVAIAAMDPSLTVIAPVREWGFSRDEEIAYAEAHQVPIPVTRSSPYSIDVNLWGRSAEGGAIEDPSQPVPEDAYAWTVAPERCPDTPTRIRIGFEAGRPVSLDGERLPLVELIERLNRIAGQNGVGRLDLVENRLVGIKSREVYEAPAAVTLITAHRALEQLVLTRDVAHLKWSLEPRYAELAYNGLWHSPARQALEAFMKVATQNNTGEVQVALYRGQVRVEGRTSPVSLYAPELATYGTHDLFDHRAAKGFVDLWGLPIRTRARVEPLAQVDLSALNISVMER
ncbi:MAG: argininosuccinate synthase [Actinomycetia bacterium]|jgi:argininosuccinate synthase|nr:argininosuccinate synthase [Actinomycetes bacterium]